MKVRISAMAAISDNRALGKDNKLLFRIPEDFERMKKITSGQPIIMGRKTFESIGRPLPGRLNVVITRNPFQIDPQNKMLFASSLEEALGFAKDAEGQRIK